MHGKSSYAIAAHCPISFFRAKSGSAIHLKYSSIAVYTENRRKGNNLRSVLWRNDTGMLIPHLNTRSGHIIGTASVRLLL